MSDPMRSTARDFLKSPNRDRLRGSLPPGEFIRFLCWSGASRRGHAHEDEFNQIVPNNPANPDLPGFEETVIYYKGDLTNPNIGFEWVYPEDQEDDSTYILNQGVSGAGGVDPLRSLLFQAGYANVWGLNFFNGEVFDYEMTIRVWGLVPLCNFSSVASIQDQSVVAYKTNPFLIFNGGGSFRNTLNPVVHPITQLPVRAACMNHVTDPEAGLFFLDQLITLYGRTSSGVNYFDPAITIESYPNTLLRQFRNLPNDPVVGSLSRSEPNHTSYDPVNPVGTPVNSGFTLFDGMNALANKSDLIQRAIGMCAHLVSLRRVSAPAPMRYQIIRRDLVSNVGSASLP